MNTKFILGAAAAAVVALAVWYGGSRDAFPEESLTDGQTPAQEQQEDRQASAGDVLSVHYEGRLEDGTVFDSSYERGAPFQFTLGAGQVIEGWDKGLEGMKVGEKKELVIPPEQGYGAQGRPPVIPPNATLIFDVELVAIQN